FSSTIAAPAATLTAPSAFKLIGTRIPRQDIPGIVTGTGTYIHNVRVPAMLHGRVVRPRGQAALTQGAPIARVDPAAIAHIPDARVCQVGTCLGVVARLEWSSIQAAAELKVTWADVPAMLPGNQGLETALRDP